MPAIEVASGADPAAVGRLVDAAAAADGLLPHLDLAARPDVVVEARDGGRLVGYAQRIGGAVEYVIDPPWRDAVDAAALLRPALPGVLWVSAPTPPVDALAARLGLRARRDLLQVRRPLPAVGEITIATRPFVPGQDEEAWLAVNNRAFSWHPEQGGWDAATLQAREKEAWFDPAGFLLYEEDGRLAGFCWTKVHPPRGPDPAMGEIYVIATDPDFGGRGLGRQLVLAGLDHLARKGLSVGMLYVDATNTTARALYDKLGFAVHHTDRAYAVLTPTSDPIP